MDSQYYFKDWVPIANTVKDRLKNRSLVHTFSSKKRIGESTKAFNKYARKYYKALSYSEFLQCKKSILEKVAEDKVVTDESDFSDNDYKKFYNSFQNSDIKNTEVNSIDKAFSWITIDKNTKYYKMINSKENIQCDSLDTTNNVSVATKNKKVSSIKKTNNKKISSKKLQHDSNSLIEDQLKNKSDQSLMLSNNNTNNSKTNSIDNVDGSKVDSEKKQVTKRASSVKKVKDLENSSPKKVTNKKSATNVKKNLSSLINDIESKAIQPLDEDDWNDEFIVSDFRAQSTQICSETFSEINHRMSLNNLKLPQNEKVNQPRDSGIEEDSREDNLNNDNLVTNKKMNSKNKKNLEDKISDDKKNTNEECDKNETSINKKLPLKIREEKITKKYTIISKDNIKLKSVEEETNVSKVDVEGQENNESEDECVDAQISKNDKDSKTEEKEEKDNDYYGDKATKNNENENECIDAQISEINMNSEKQKEEEEDSDHDYYCNLRDYGSEEDSGAEKNNSESENNISINMAAPLNQSALKKKKQRKSELKKELQRCKSPFMKQKYKELNEMGLLSDIEIDSDEESITVNKENKETEENIEKTYFSLTPIDMESITNDTTFGENNKNNLRELKNNEASDEEQITISNKFSENDIQVSCSEPNKKYENEDDDEQDLSQYSKRHLQQLKKLDLFNNSESSDDSEAENINKTLKEKSEENLMLQNSKEYYQQMKRMGLDSSNEDSNDSSNSKNENNKSQNKKLIQTNAKKGKDKNKKDINKSENSDKYNNTKKIKKSRQNSGSFNIKSKKCKQEDDIVSNTTSPQSPQSITNSSKFKDIDEQKNKIQNISNSREHSYEIDKQEELTKFVENYKQSMQSKDKNDASDSEKESSSNTKKHQKIKNLNHSNNELESRNEENQMVDDKKKLLIRKKTNEIKYSEKEDNSLKNNKLNTTSEEKEDNIISSNLQKLEKLRKQYDELSSSENSNQSEKLNIIDSADSISNMYIEEHKILNKNKIPEAIKSIHQDNLSSTVVVDKESSSSTSQHIDVEHCSSEAETINKRKRKKSFSSESSEKDKEIDVETLSPKVLNHLKKFKRFDFSKESEEDSDNEKIATNLNESKHKNNNASSPTLKAMNNASDDESDNDESDREMSPSTTQRLKQFKKMNLLCNSSSSEDEDITVKNKISIESLVQKKDSQKLTNLIYSDSESLKSEKSTLSQKRTNLFHYDSDSESLKSEKSTLSKKPTNLVDSDSESLKPEKSILSQKPTNLVDSDSESLKSEKSTLSQKDNKSDPHDLLKKKSPNKFNSAKNHTHSQEVDTKINEKANNSSKNIIIGETQDSEDTPKKLESQELFSSLEDLTKGVKQNILKLAEESGLDSNAEIANQIPPTQQPKKIYTKRIKKIPELVEKENLLKGSYESTMTFKDISSDEEIFILEVPKSVFSDGDLIGKKMTFSKETLMFGDTNMYEAFERIIPPVYSCVFKLDDNTKNSFKTLNIRPTTEIVARRKKHLDDSNRQDDLKSDEEYKNSEISPRVTKKNHTPVKNKVESSKKLHKRKRNVEDEKDIKSENKERKEKKVLKKNKTKRGLFHLDNFIDTKRRDMSIEESTILEEEFVSKKNLSLSSDNDSIKDEKDEKDNEVFTNISNSIVSPKSKKSKTPVKNVDGSKVDSEKKQVTKRASSVKKVKDLENSSPKKITNKKSATNVKKNLSSLINDIESKAIQPLDEDDSNSIVSPKSKKSKTPVKNVANVDLNKEKQEKKVKAESKSVVAKVKTEKKKSSDTNASNDNKEPAEKSKLSTHKEKKSKKKDTNAIKPEVKKESKPKKLKIAVTEDKPEFSEEPIAGPSSNIPKNPKSPKTTATDKKKSTKRKAETKNGDDVAEKPKKRKIAAEKKPKASAATDKTTTASKASKKTTLKKKKQPMADVAAKEILNIIQKTMKFNTEKHNSSNSSLDNSKYEALDIERVPVKNKRYASTTSSSDEEKLNRHSFKVRSKPMLQESSSSSSSEDDKDKVEAKDDEKKKKKKSFFFDV